MLLRKTRFSTNESERLCDSLNCDRRTMSLMKRLCCLSPEQQFQGSKYCDEYESCICLFYLVGTLGCVVLISLVQILSFSYCTERG